MFFDYVLEYFYIDIWKWVFNWEKIYNTYFVFIFKFSLTEFFNHNIEKFKTSILSARFLAGILHAFHDCI